MTITADPTPAAAAPTQAPWRRGVRHLAAVQARVPVVQLLGIAACLGYGAARVPDFVSRTNILTIGVLASLLALTALGQTGVIMMGGIDLSVGNMLSFGAVVVPYYATSWHLPFLLVALAGLAAGAIVGTVSGWVSYHFGVHPLMITLATGTCVQGAILVTTQGSTSGLVPNWLSSISLPTSKTFGIGIPPVICICLLLTVVSIVVLSRTPFGRRLYAVGTNQRAAGLALVHTQRVWIGVFAFSAMCAVVAGILVGSFSGTGDPHVGDPYLFLSVAAVLIGGTAMEGGRGDYPRTVIGAVLLTVITTTLTSLNYGSADIQILSGLLIFLIVLNSSRERSARERI